MDDNDISIELNDSFIDALTSTPVKQRRPGLRRNANAAVFKAPLPPAPASRGAAKRPAVKKPPKKKKPTLTCNDCGKQYVCQGSYKNHCRTHAIQAASEKYPDRGKILENLNEIIAPTLKKVIESPSGGNVNESAQYFLDHIDECPDFQLFAKKVCEEFLSDIISKKFVLPSKLRDALVKQCDIILSSPSLRTDFVATLLFLWNFSSSEEVDFFICEYVLCFCEELLKFIARSIHGGGSVWKKPVELDQADRQAIHYIGGAILRGFIKKTKMYPSSKMWLSIKDIILHKMVENANDVAEPGDKSWTVSRDRGKLLHIGDSCLEFLVLVAEIIEANEEPNGSVSVMKVYEKVVDSLALTVYWDGMISDNLSEDVSLLFLRALVKSFCQIYGRGISRRRINTMKELPEASIALRHSLVRKVTR